MLITKDKIRVVIRTDGHLDQHSDVIPLLKEALSRVNTKGNSFLAEEVNMGRCVGTTSCVATDARDEVVFAFREGRDGPTRFVKNRTEESCSHVTVVLKKVYGSREYVLITAFVGRKAEREPWDRNIKTAHERSISLQFWRTHALVWGSQKIIPHTETTKRLW